MNKKIFISVALATVLATGLYAKGNCDRSCDFGNKSHKMMKKAHGGFMSMVYSLELTNDQLDKISQIKKQRFENKVPKHSAFTQTGFDKDKYIEQMKQKRQNAIEARASMIDDIYKILNKEQKIQLKQMMDDKEKAVSRMMQKRMNFDKNCNGRR